MSKVFQMKNRELISYVNFLMQLKLKGKESRKRMKFVRKFTIYLQSDYETEKNVILDEYVEKDEKGDFKVVKGGYVTSDALGLNKELIELDNELYKEDITSSNYEDFEFLLNITTDFDEELALEEALNHDNYCTALEKALERDDEL